MTQAFPGQNISSVTVITRPKQSRNNKIYDYKLKRIIELHACDELSGRHYYRKNAVSSIRCICFIKILCQYFLLCKDLSCPMIITFESNRKVLFFIAVYTKTITAGRALF